MEQQVESIVLEKFYSDVQRSILDPVRVASLLRQEGVVAESLIDEVSPTNRFTLSERTASILRHVKAAVRVNRQSFWAFIAVLEQSGPPACNVAQQMRNAVKLHSLAAEKKNGSSSASYTEGDLFVSEVYQTDFDGIKRNFLSLHLRISKILANSDCVTLENLKELLAFYSELKGPLQAAETITSVMDIVQQHSSVINCSYLQHIAEHFNLPDVGKEIEAYCKRVDEFCQQTIRQHSYVTSFMAEQQNHILSTQTLTLKLEWKPDDKTLVDIQSLIRKTFKSLSDLIHVVVVKEGSVTVICYAPHYIMGTLVQMAKESKSMLLENSVSYLSIGYTVVLDSTAQDWYYMKSENDTNVSSQTKIRDLTQENTALQLRLTALQEQCQELQSHVQLALSKTKSDIENIVLEKQEIAPRQSEPDEMADTFMRPELGPSNLLPFPSLESTGLSPSEVSVTGLTPDGFKYLMEHQLVKSIGLTGLSLSEVAGLAPDGFKYLMEHQLVRSIGLKNSPAAPYQVEAIFQGLRSNTSFVRLNVPPTSSPVNVSTLSASLTVNNTLQDLEFSSFLDDHAIELLSAALRVNRSLHRLTLHHTVTDTGAQHLATMLTANTTLQELELFSSLISDTGILHLSEALKHNNSLTVLCLCSSKHITNTGAVALSKMLLVNKSLRILDLYGTSIEEKGTDALIESLLHNQVLMRLTLPNCTVEL